MAPEGTVLTVELLDRPPGESEAASAVGAALGPGLVVDLEGRQPRLPLTLTIPVDYADADRNFPVLLTEPSDGSEAHLVPAEYDPAGDTLTAELDHLSGFWPFQFDLGAWLTPLLDGVWQTFSLRAQRPDRSGADSETESGARTYLRGGEFGEGADPYAWMCLGATDDTTAVTLTGNRPVPLRVRADAGTFKTQEASGLGETAMITVFDWAVDALGDDTVLLLPQDGVTVTVATSDLPGRPHGAFPIF